MFGFTGQRIDAETGGLYYYRARTYSPKWGRFLQPDPNKNGKSNRYAYANNDPLNKIDPSGEIFLADNLVGAGVAFGVNLIAQAALAEISGQPLKIDWTAAVVAAGLGFVTSGASSFLTSGISSLELGSASSFALTTTGNAAIGALGNVWGTATLNSLEGTDYSLSEAAIFGGGFGAVGSIVGGWVTEVGPSSALSRLDAMTPGWQNLLSGVEELSEINLLSPTPLFVTAGVATSNAISPSFIPASNGSNLSK